MQKFFLQKNQSHSISLKMVVVGEFEIGEAEESFLERRLGTDCGRFQRLEALLHSKTTKELLAIWLQ